MEMESLSLGSKGRKRASSEARELKMSSLRSISIRQSLEWRLEGGAYVVPPLGRTLSLGRLDSMSIAARSRGRSSS